MEKIVIVGSGASGVHFALSLLRKGYGVVMVDVGHLKSKPQNPDDTFDELKANLPDPAAYFLGKKYEAVVYPTDQEDYYTKYYGFPPSKSRIFDTPLPHQYRAKGFEPLFSFAQGGLAEAWTAGVYPLNEGELHDFPFSYSEIEPCYNEVAKRMGIMAAQDDLTKFFPYHENLLEPLRLDYNSQLLIAAYNKRKSELNSRLNCYLGRSRVGTLSADKDERPACSYCGRCLWGCPTESLYTPSITLRECRAYANFHYVPHMYVSHFDYDRAGKISRVVARSVEDQTDHYFTGDRYVLSAGALSSAKIFMQSIYKQEGRVVKLSGLMDNRQILIPFVNLKMLGKGYRADSYQYHQLAVGIESERPEEYIHGQITTLKSALVHPIIQNLPFDLRTSISVFRNLRSCLGIVNLNLYDRRRDTNYVSLEMTEDAEAPKLDIHYAPDSNEDAIIEHAVGTIRKFLWKLGCVVPPGMTHVRPMGASVHYTGTIPMSEKKLPLTTSKHCQSHDFENLYIVDGTTFPFLPAKNITFSLMANAVRVAERAF